jgi:hypothetical protein
MITLFPGLVHTPLGVSVPDQERELSYISVLLLSVCTKPGKRVIMYICVVIEMSLPSQEREVSCISVLLLRCMYQSRKESYHVYL